MPSLAEIILQGGRIQSDSIRQAAEIEARRRQQSGQIWGGAIANIGQQVGQGIQAWQQEKKDAPILAEEARLRGLNLDIAELNLTEAQKAARAKEDAATKQQAYDRLMGSMLEEGPNGLPQISPEKMFAALQQAGMAEMWPDAVNTMAATNKMTEERQVKDRDILGRYAATVINFGNEPQVAINLIKLAEKQELISERASHAIQQQIEANPDSVAQIMEAVLAQASKDVQALVRRPEGYTLSEGQTRFEGGQPVASVPKPPPTPPPPAPFTLGPGQVRFNEAGQRIAGVPPTPTGGSGDGVGQIGGPATPAQQALVDSIMKTPSLYARLTPTVGTALIPLLSQAGFDFEAALKADSKMGSIPQVLAKLRQLSAKINTHESGLGAVFGGGARGLAAKAQYDNDVSLYESIATAFIPMVARGLGHTGVLTEKDVQSAREALPHKTENKKLAASKMDFIETLFGGGTATPTGEAYTGTVRWDADGNPFGQINGQTVALVSTPTGYTVKR
jgi:hypothetical protein